VGFDVSAEERKQLEAIAKIGKGTYYNVRTATELSDALAAAVNIGYAVLDEKGQKEVAQGLLNGSPVGLPAGTYQVQLRGVKDTAITVRTQPRQTIELILTTEGKLDHRSGNGPKSK
jgi:hypothetical protein